MWGKQRVAKPIREILKAGIKKKIYLFYSAMTKKVLVYLLVVKKGLVADHKS